MKAWCAGGAKRWKLLSLIVALPGVAVCWINAYIINAGHPEQPEFIAYPHLRLRTKVCAVCSTWGRWGGDRGAGEEGGACVILCGRVCAVLYLYGRVCVILCGSVCNPVWEGVCYTVWMCIILCGCITL